MRSKRTIRLIRLGLMLTAIIAAAHGTLAQGANPSDSRSPFAQNVNEIKDLQVALSTAAYYKARAEAAEQSRDQWKAQSEDWHSLFNSEHERAALLQSATGDRKS